MSTFVGIETARIVTVAQIVEGDAECHCGKPAVLLVETDPDNDPGLTCYEHAKDWIDVTMHLVNNLFGPKEQ